MGELFTFLGLTKVRSDGENMAIRRGNWFDFFRVAIKWGLLYKSGRRGSEF